MRLIPIALGLFAANYFWQAISHADYSLAFERSFFQAIALVCAGVAYSVPSKHRVEAN